MGFFNIKYLEMELTGKCKKDFEKWFLKDVKKQLKEIVGGWFDKQILNSLYNTLTNSMQYGVYVDFFDSVDMEVFIDYSRVDMFRFDIFHHFISLGYGSPFKTRQEARTEAIKKANEIYNSR